MESALHPTALDQPPYKCRGIAPGSATLFLCRDISDDVILVAVGDARERRHGGAGHHDGRERDPGTEQTLGPFEVRGIAEGVGVLEPRHRAGALADDAEQVGAEAIVAAL